MTLSPDPLLREALAGRAPDEGSPECLDAERLAAWFEGTLAAGARRVAEAHVADCARCQMLLAAMARTAPPDAPRPWWRTSALKWMVPLTAAAASVVVWVNLFDRTVRREAAPAHAAQESPRQSASATPAVPPVPPPATQEDRVDTGQQARAKRDTPSVAASRDERRREVDALSKAESGMREQAAATPPVPAPPVETLKDSQLLPGVAPVPPPPAGETAAAPTATRLRAPAAAAAPATAAPSTAPARRADVAAGAVAETVTTTDAVARQARGFGVVEVAGGIVIQSASDPQNRWRIRGATVERSTNGGARWQAQSVGVKATFTAGSSPSANVCWIVGAGGVVILSTDGRSWQRVPFPERADLIAVAATDARSAIVTTNDGRQFRTTDAGTTWK
jgi:hypothetical protein